MNIDFMNLNFRNRISKNINYKNVWITSMNTRRTRIASLFAIFLLLRRVLSWATRWRLHRQIESYYDGRYALNEEDVRKGLPRMNQCGYRGVHDAQTILRLVQFKESPLLYHKALEFALFRTYAIPSISKILLATGNLSQSDKSTRRYMDTVLLITSFSFYPLPRADSESKDKIVKQPAPTKSRREPPWLHDEDVMFEKEDPRAAIALARTNWLHRRANKTHGPKGAPISNDDLLYTLSVFVTQPIFWLQRFGWRSMSALERESIFTVWEHIGKCMGIEGIPDTLDGLIDWAEKFEQKSMIYAPQNTTVGIETVNLLLYHVPPFMRKPLFPLVTALMDERLRKGVGYLPASALVAWIPKTALYSWSLWLRWFGLPRGDYGTRVPYYGDEKADLIGAMCPVSNKTSEFGDEKCPAHGEEFQGKPSMVPKWTDNEPHYMKPLPVTSLRGIYERLFVSPEDRWGTKRWQQFRNKNQHGYRLEQCGPRGLEKIGYDEMRDEVHKLSAQRPMVGPWAF